MGARFEDRPRPGHPAAVPQHDHSIDSVADPPSGLQDREELAAGPPSADVVGVEEPVGPGGVGMVKHVPSRPFETGLEGVRAFRKIAARREPGCRFIPDGVFRELRPDDAHR